jgi:4-hydroxythreonine-4-phosphate dehydrogenase
MVTAPVSKQALRRAGVRFDGQTEFLAHLTKAGDATMMLVSGSMRVALVTIHKPLRKVAGLIDRKLLKRKIRGVHDGLVRDFGIRSPKLAVLGLNPHGGEGGDIGEEEGTILAPVVRMFHRKGMRIRGPFPADSFFSAYRKARYDVIIAMYHDQGLIPLKMAGGGGAVNVTLGLPVVRTSPDHGTAFDIAGRGIADPGSMIEAIRMAVAIVRNRARRGSL